MLQSNEDVLLLLIKLMLLMFMCSKRNETNVDAKKLFMLLSSMPQKRLLQMLLVLLLLLLFNTSVIAVDYYVAAKVDTTIPLMIQMLLIPPWQCSCYWWCYCTYYSSRSCWYHCCWCYCWCCCCCCCCCWCYWIDDKLIFCSHQTITPTPVPFLPPLIPYSPTPHYVRCPLFY